MQKNTLSYTISLILCLLAISVKAQKTEQKTDTVKVKLYNGATIYADVASVISSMVSNGEIRSVEGALQVDLRHKYFPVFEMGYASINKGSNNDILFNANGMFSRVGVDFNMSKKKDGDKKNNSTPTNNLFIAGLRLGMSSFNYDISNMVVTDSYWNKTETLSYNDQSTKRFWWEIVVSIRVEVTKNVYMGWSVRNKHLLTKDTSGALSPWYIPGFGTNTGNANTALNYVIGYHF